MFSDGRIDVIFRESALILLRMYDYLFPVINNHVIYILMI